MTTIAWDRPGTDSRQNFYVRMALVMGLTVVAGFSLQWLTGRSTFQVRPLVHVHGLVFMGWVGIFVGQAWLAAHGPRAAHRLLGRIASGWVVLMVVVGCWINIDAVQLGRVPFFFQPQHFLIVNPLNLGLFAVLVAAAVRLRHRQDWHMRLQLCAMAAVIGPAFGRILPMPLIGPYAFDIALLAGLVFPLAGVVRDLRRSGQVHPAWWWGMLGIIAAVPVARLIAFSPLGDAIYVWATAGHPGAAMPGLAFGTPPPI